MMKLILTGKAQKYQYDKQGIYILQEKEMHSKKHWRSEQLYFDFGLWWNRESSYWIIGKYVDVGASSGTIMGPPNDDSLPINIDTWKFYYEKEKWFGKTKNEWVDAGINEIKFIDMIANATNSCWIDATSSDLNFKQVSFVKGTSKFFRHQMVKAVMTKVTNNYITAPRA